MEKYAVLMEHITKNYPGVVALNDVTVGFEEGQVHALLGENGAGKSTLIKVLSGAVENDEGSISVNGNRYEKMTPLTSRKNGIEVIYQEYNLIDSLTVAENVYLGNKLHGLVNKKEMVERTKAVLDMYEINLDPNAYLKELSLAQKQLVEIVKAVSKDAKVIVMDEPTAQLTVSEVQKLYEIIRSLKKRNITIIYISHRLEELFEITDCITVMRDGNYITTVNTCDTNRDELISLMVGRELTNIYPKRDCVTDKVSLELKNVYGYSNENISFKLHEGEVLGFAGLVGAGRTEIARVIFGADKKLSGDIYVYGKKQNIRSPKDAIKAGLGLIPEDRKAQGCFLNMSIEWNIVISNIHAMTKKHLVNNKKIEKCAEDYKNKLNIKTPSIKQVVRNLSGGNQQKVVLAKTLAANSDIIIFDEPTRGIDIGARHEIYELIKELVENKKSVIMISSDMEELIGMSDRIIVLSEGKIKGELSKEEFNQERVLRLASNE